LINFNKISILQMKYKVRWGIIGLGSIANKFAKDLQLVAEAELVAVASRSIEKANMFGNEYNVKHIFGSYEDLFNCKEVDVVYIATPHTLHERLSITAMNFGKHVLCEKPAGINSKEVERIIAAAKKNNTFFMEALWSRFNPTIKKVKELVDEGTIGTVKYISATFAFYAMDRDVQNRLLNVAYGGGSILDIGIYPIFLAYLMLGTPNEIMATSNFSSQETEIQTAVIFKYTQAHAMLYSGFTSNSEMNAEISGSKGTITILPRWHEATQYSIKKEGTEEIVEIPKLGKGYTHEIEEVHKCIKEGRKESELWSYKNSLDLAKLLDKVRKQSGVVFPFEAKK